MHFFGAIRSVLFGYGADYRAIMVRLSGLLVNPDAVPLRIAAIVGQSAHSATAAIHPVANGIQYAPSRWSLLP